MLWHRETSQSDTNSLIYWFHGRRKVANFQVGGTGPMLKFLVQECNPVDKSWPFGVRIFPKLSPRYTSPSLKGQERFTGSHRLQLLQCCRSIGSTSNGCNDRGGRSACHFKSQVENGWCFNCRRRTVIPEQKRCKKTRCLELKAPFINIKGQHALTSKDRILASKIWWKRSAHALIKGPWGAIFDHENGHQTRSHRPPTAWTGAWSPQGVELNLHACGQTILGAGNKWKRTCTEKIGERARPPPNSVRKIRVRKPLLYLRNDFIP